ncbi:hypothetical protein RB195_022176 [Necator americanus]|uniref:ethanolamine kinase n=1 Tax=Necator americanus TaxID=51031 RepID=A0ABR1EE80_NECAM
MNSSFVNIELSLTNHECCEHSAKEVLRILRPQWQLSLVRFEVLTAGITNKIMSASVDSNEKLVFRIFGKNTGNFIDRDRELSAMEKLAREGLAAPLYARFSNGILCGYLPGTTVTADQLKNTDMQRKICSTLAAYHNMDSTVVEVNDLFPFRKTKDFINNIDLTAIENYREDLRYIELACKWEDCSLRLQEKDFFNLNIALRGLLNFANRLSDNIKDIETLIVPLEEEITFCHNDLLANNIIFDDSSGKVLFIDYEYADFNYAIFDLANHFCEFAGVDNPDYTKCPNQEEMRIFLRFYLQARHGYVDEIRLENLLRRVSLFQALAHLLWSAWSVVQSQNSTLRFDYVSYAKVRYEQYMKCLDNYTAQQQF